MQEDLKRVLDALASIRGELNTFLDAPGPAEAEATVARLLQIVGDERLVKSQFALTAIVMKPGAGWA